MTRIARLSTRQFDILDILHHQGMTSVGEVADRYSASDNAAEKMMRRMMAKGLVSSNALLEAPVVGRPWAHLWTGSGRQALAYAITPLGEREYLGALAALDALSA